MYVVTQGCYNSLYSKTIWPCSQNGVYISPNRPSASPRMIIIQYIRSALNPDLFSYILLCRCAVMDVPVGNAPGTDPVARASGTDPVARKGMHWDGQSFEFMHEKGHTGHVCIGDGQNCELRIVSSECSRKASQEPSQTCVLIYLLSQVCPSYLVVAEEVFGGIS